MITKQHIFFVIMLTHLSSNAQHKTEHINMLWTGYYNTVSFNKNWSLVSDGQLRTKDWTNKWSQILVRSGASYNFNNKAAVTIGFAFFKNAQYLEKQLFLKTEWRLWQEFSYQVKFNKINLTQRIRTEQRFIQQLVNNTLTEKYEYIFRFRYRSDLQIPLNENNLKLLMGNEVLVNPGFINTTRFFDQDRIFAGLNYKVTNHTTLQLQYLKIFQWHSNTSVLDDANVFRFNIYQQFNFKNNQHSK